MRRIDERGPRQITRQPEQQPQQPQQPFGAGFGATIGYGGASGPVRAPEWEKAEDAERYDLRSLSGEQARRSGPWKLYDEKFLLDGKNAFNSKN